MDSADKAARFITMCDAFNIPLIFLHDVPGFMVGVAVERQGIIRHGAKMITAMASAEVPKFSVILRKSYAAGYYAMGARASPRGPRSRCRPSWSDLDLLRLASELVVDVVVEPGELRAELVARLADAELCTRGPRRRHHHISPV